jgi:hypothetical protein
MEGVYQHLPIASHAALGGVPRPAIAKMWALYAHSSAASELHFCFDGYALSIAKRPDPYLVIFIRWVPRTEAP